jgi:hypothetical protein
VVYREVSTEGSQPANSGTDEQKLDMRLDKPDEQAHHCDVLKPERECVYQVDSAGIGGRKMLLPGETSLVGYPASEESAEAIVVDDTVNEGLNVKLFQML